MPNQHHNLGWLLITLSNYNIYLYSDKLIVTSVSDGGSNFASGSQKIDHQCIDLVGNLDLHPMACVGNPFELELGNPRL